jgi:nucleotide-binding universal stress UspA family protein
MTALRLAKILAPTDLSPPAEAAVAYAHALAERFGAELHVLHVATNLDELTRLHGATGVLDTSAAADDYDTWLAGLLGEAGAVRRVEAVRIGADVASTICHYAQAEAIDLIVMATHGRTALIHLVLGSVAEHVLRAAPCPLLTLRGWAGAKP